MFNPAEKWPIGPEKSIPSKEAIPISEEQTEEQAGEQIEGRIGEQVGKRVGEQKEYLFDPKIGEFSIEDKAMSEKKLDNLGSLMKGADFNWWLDGGLNIPIYKGEYYRAHKDIEISINQEDIEKFYSWLRGKGYNLFDTTLFEHPKKLSFQELTSIGECHNLVISDVEEYEGHTSSEIELHICERDGQGNQIVDDVTIPKKYFENLPKYKTVSGYEISLSHPVVVAFHKLRMERGDPFEPLEEKLRDAKKSYDIEDLKGLMASLSNEDMEALERLAVEARNKRIERISQKIEQIFNSLDLKGTISEIRQSMEKSIELDKREGEAKPKYRKIIQIMASYVTENPDITFDQFSSKLKEIIDLDEKTGRWDKKLKIIKKEKRGSIEGGLPEKIENLLSEEERNRYENFEEEKKEKEIIFEAIKEIYANTQEAKIRAGREGITIDEAKSEVKEKSMDNPIIAEYVSRYVNEIVDIAFKSETEQDYIETLREKYADGVRKKIEEKFSSKREPKEEKQGAEEKIKETPEVETEIK